MKNEFGRVECFRMHDVIRHLAIDKAEEECFGKVYEGHGTFSLRGTCRLSIQGTNIVPLDQSSATHVREIYTCMSSVDIGFLRPILASSLLLSTLDLEGSKIQMLPNEVFSLFNLRFLRLRKTGIEMLPAAIGRLQNLEVLDIVRTCLLSLPKNVAKLRKLRHLHASTKINEGYFSRQGGVKVPRGIRNLTGLHVLGKLRHFGVDDVTREHALFLRAALLNMSSLVSLAINMSNKNEVLPLQELCLPESLSDLVLIGQLENKKMPRILSSWLHLNNLTHLELVFSKLDENSFSSLMVLSNLCFLSLCKSYDGKTLCFSAQSFPRLTKLRILGAVQLNQIQIAEDALGSLAMLRFLQCPELKRLPHGIEYLTALDELYLLDTADEFIEMLRQEPEANECKEELKKISRIKIVIVQSTEKNFRQGIVSSNGNEFSGSRLGC
ncbi:hypothetical protein PVAP13_8KG088000 [Panicum virgatum]|uniref:Disease resistance R13L4/SHOC-2-like LRR domain-containing protein n=1 Tax=Panicum virgatum TaxID=38727 RepID=A0A8T0PIA3_PANVG|nr:hypothetical protein PVAP13_8KG088000 [Panicum virgatum]